MPGTRPCPTPEEAAHDARPRSEEEECKEHWVRVAGRRIPVLQNGTSRREHQVAHQETQSPTYQRCPGEETADP